MSALLALLALCRRSPRAREKSVPRACAQKSVSCARARARARAQERPARAQGQEHPARARARERAQEVPSARKRKREAAGRVGRSRRDCSSCVQRVVPAARAPALLLPRPLAPSDRVAHAVRGGGGFYCGRAESARGSGHDLGGAGGPARALYEPPRRPRPRPRPRRRRSRRLRRDWLGWHGKRSVAFRVSARARGAVGGNAPRFLPRSSSFPWRDSPISS